jgi:hypothetical protein
VAGLFRDAADSYFTQGRPGTGIQQNDIPPYRECVGSVEGFITGMAGWASAATRFANRRKGAVVIASRILRTEA